MVALLLIVQLVSRFQGIKKKYLPAEPVLLPPPTDLHCPLLFRFLSTYQEASDLYGLIHSRFITSPKGKLVKIVGARRGGVGCLQN